MPHDPASVLVKRAPKLALPLLEYSCNRLRTTLDDGRDVAVVLPHGTVIHDGDVLVAEDGTLAEVQVASEHVLRVANDNRLALIRATYHLGNRYTPVQVSVDALRFEANPVPEDMLIPLGVTVAHVETPFELETGAYDDGHRHGHDAMFEGNYAVAQVLYHEHYGCDHSHSYVHDHDYGHSRGHDHGHVHGPGCGYHHHHRD